jgi:hypothetical protein
MKNSSLDLLRRSGFRNCHSDDEVVLVSALTPALTSVLISGLISSLVSTFEHSDLDLVSCVSSCHVKVQISFNSVKIPSLLSFAPVACMLYLRDRHLEVRIVLILVTANGIVFVLVREVIIFVVTASPEFLLV